MSLGYRSDMKSTDLKHLRFLFPGSSSLALRRLEQFRQGLRELGYVEGQNIHIETKVAEGDFKRLSILASELARLPVDVIVTAATAGVQAAKEATSTIPIVMIDPGDPVSNGLVTNLAHPEGNITGLSSATPDLVAKHLELLRAAIPELSNIAFLWNVTTPDGALAFQKAQVAAQILQVQLHSVEIRGFDDFERAFTDIIRTQAAALLVFTDPITLSQCEWIVKFTTQRRLPAMFGAREFVAAGGLMSYGPSFPNMFQRAAVFVDKILRGAKPSALPAERPTPFELVINFKTAMEFGLTISEALLSQADEVVQ
jgi:putative ABC transport system substrate-binding protein